MSTNPDSCIDKLGERGFAGGDVATSPSRDDDSFWPQGASPIGVLELIDLIEQAFRQKPGARKKESHWVFLLGGAGNGKSFAARVLLNRLAPRTQKARESGVPKRKYEAKVDDTKVCVINDATIAAKADYQDKVKIALAEDILLWAGQARRGRSLGFACVNRGIILEELSSLLRLQRKGLAISEAVLRWLGGEDKSVFDASSLTWVSSIEGSSQGSWYRRVRLTIDKNSAIVIHGLSVDVGSLFDPRIAMPLDVRSESAVTPDLNVAPDFRTSSLSRLESVAGKLVSDLLSSSLKGAADRRNESCPLRANLETLALPEARASWLTALRGAEISAGRQTTYRDFWGLVALSLTGPRTVSHSHGIGMGSVTAEVDESLNRLSSDLRPVERLEILGKLASRRLHMAIFRGEAVPLHDGELGESPPDFPAARGLVQLDPALDVSQYSTLVEMAIEHVSLDATPSEFLRDKVPELSAAWRPFDSMIEQSILDVVNDDDTSDRVRRRLLGWLSGYLVRACGCYVGGIGHETVVSAWYRCWHAAGRANPQFPADLDTGLRTLLLPAVSFQANMEKQLTIPAFASRAVPFETAESADGSLVLSLGVNHLRLRPMRKQDRLWIELVSPDSAVQAHSPLDFALLREALVSRTGAYGFTESGDQTAPRLERARASMTSTGSRATRRFGLISGGSLRELLT